MTPKPKFRVETSRWEDTDRSEGCVVCGPGVVDLRDHTAQTGHATYIERIETKWYRAAPETRESEA